MPPCGAALSATSRARIGVSDSATHRGGRRDLPGVPGRSPRRVFGTVVRTATVPFVSIAGQAFEDVCWLRVPSFGQVWSRARLGGAEDRM